MKKMFFLILLDVALFASIHWQTNFDKAYKLSQKSGKPLFVFIERLDPPCKWCHKMKTTTLKDPQIANYINEHFIPVKLERNTDEYPDELFPQYVPTIYIIKDDTIYKRIVGYWPKKDFQSDLKDFERLNIK